MANGFYLTPTEQIDFLDDCKKDKNGNLAYGAKAAAILEIAMKRALEEEAAAEAAEEAAETPEPSEPPLAGSEEAQTEKREKKSLQGENLDNYVAIAKRLIEQNQREVDNGGKILSRRAFAAGLKLGESTVRQNKSLNDIYKRFRENNSNVRPSTLDNDPDSFFDDDF